MQFDAVYTVEKEFDKEVFLRQVLVTLGTDPNTPIDAVHAKFGEVREGYEEVILCSAEVSGLCSASVGYDRKESYVDYEKYREKIGDRYVERTRPVTKYRTVTDWRPFSTPFSGKAVCAVHNDESAAEDGYAITALKTMKDSGCIREGTATVRTNAYNAALALCKATVHTRDVNIPGDHVKDRRYQDTVDVENLDCFKLPCYYVSFTYEGTEYKASCYACGTVLVNCEKPPMNMDIEAETKELTVLSRATSKLTWAIFWVALGVSAAACFLLKICWLWPAVVAALVLAALMNKKYNADFNQCALNLTTDIGAAKLKELKKALKDHGYKELTEKESVKVETKNMPDPVKAKGFGGKLFLSIVLTVALVIASFVVRDMDIHSDRHVDLELVAMTQQQVDGDYVISMDYEIEAKRVGVEYITVKVYISDKTGKDLGSLDTNLRDLHIAPGETETITATWETRSLDNQFFAAVYNAELSDLRFEYEIQRIDFADGKYYTK